MNVVYKCFFFVHYRYQIRLKRKRERNGGTPLSSTTNGEGIYTHILILLPLLLLLLLLLLYVYVVYVCTTRTLYVFIKCIRAHTSVCTSAYISVCACVLQNIWVSTANKTTKRWLYRFELGVLGKWYRTIPVIAYREKLFDIWNKYSYKSMLICVLNISTEYMYSKYRIFLLDMHSLNDTHIYRDCICVCHSTETEWNKIWKPWYISAVWYSVILSLCTRSYDGGDKWKRGKIPFWTFNFNIFFDIVVQLCEHWIQFQWVSNPIRKRRKNQRCRERSIKWPVCDKHIFLMWMARKHFPSPFCK